MPVFERKSGPKLREMILAHFMKWNSFNNPRHDGKFGIDLVDSVLNTLQTLELANVSQLFISTWKCYHTNTNIIQWFIYEAVVKYVIQGMACIKQEINPICAKFHIFSNIIKSLKEFHFLKGASITSLKFSQYYHSSA